MSTIMPSSDDANDAPTGPATHSSDEISPALRTQHVSDYKVYVVTWNVGSRFPDNISLRNLLGLHAMGDGGNKDADNQEHLPDIYVIGLQELNAHPQQQMRGLFKEDPWTRKARHLLRDFDYVLIKSEQMQGLLVSVFVKRQHVLQMREIESEFTRTGFGGIWGNKGAVSVRFNLYGCGLTFVVAHLAAHDHHLEERIEDFKQILEHHHYHVSRFREIYDHDYVFFFGDLNFRLEGSDSPAEVRDAILKEDTMKALFQRDQLTHVRVKTQEAFHLLNERLPEFPPTFKFHEGTGDYDLKRRPAWTDRILYAMQPINRQPNMPLAIEQLSYKSHPAYNISDHRPVTSEFSIKLFTHYRELSIQFTDIDVWHIGDEITVEYTKVTGFQERKHDWIGLFPENYSSLGEYVAYEYVNQSDSSSSSSSSGDEHRHAGPDAPSHRHHHHRNPQHRQRRIPQAGTETIRIDFSDDIELDTDKRYVLLYFQNTGIRGVSGVAGISNPFPAVKTARTPRPAAHED